jgi:hypothetical protein
MAEPLGELFATPEWDTPRAATRFSSGRPAAPPAPPPSPYRIAGQVVQEGAAQVVLARDNRVLVVRAGDVLDDDYQVESIRADGVTLLYKPLGVREELSVSGSLRLEVRQPWPAPEASARSIRPPNP